MLSFTKDQEPLAANSIAILILGTLVDELHRLPGQVMFRIAGPKPLAHRIGMSGLDD